MVALESPPEGDGRSDTGSHARIAMLDVRRLRLLYELHHRGTIAAVGQALHFSPSGVSQQLALLEAEAGVPLLERVGRGVRLTEAARVLVGHAEAVLRRLEEAESDLAAVGRQLRGTVRIASFQTVTLAIIPDLLDAVRDHAGLRISVAQAEPEQALPALLAHDFDLVVGEEYPGAPAPLSPELHRHDLCSDPMRLATPLGLAPTDGTPWAAVRDAAWVMEPRGTASRAWATATCRSAGFEPDVRYESDDLLAHVALVEHAHAAAFLPDLVWRGRPAAAVALQELPGARTLFTVVRRGTERHPSIRAIRATLRQLAGPLAAGAELVPQS